MSDGQVNADFNNEYDWRQDFHAKWLSSLACCLQYSFSSHQKRQAISKCCMLKNNLTNIVQQNRYV